LLEIAKEVCDVVTPTIYGEIAWDAGLAIRLGRDHGDGAAIVELRADSIVVKTFVANQRGMHAGVHARRRYAAKAAFGGEIKAFPGAVASPGDAAASLVVCRHRSRALGTSGASPAIAAA
jgi:hypothetical protein